MSVAEVTAAGDKAVGLPVRVHAAAARSDAVQRPADFVLKREAAIGAVVEWRQAVAAHAAMATACTASIGAVGDAREKRRAANDLTVLRAIARAQKLSLDAAFSATQGLLERPRVNNVIRTREVGRSLGRVQRKKTV